MCQGVHKRSIKNVFPLCGPALSAFTVTTSLVETLSLCVQQFFIHGRFKEKCCKVLVSYRSSIR